MKKICKFLIAFILTSTCLALVGNALAQNATQSDSLGDPQGATTGSLILRSDISDGDGRISLGEVFSNAGDNSGLIIGYRTGASAILDANRVQSVAASLGLYWDNASGLRKIIVRSNEPDLSTPTPISTRTIESPAKPKPPLKAKMGRRDIMIYSRAMNTGELVRAEDIEFTHVEDDYDTSALPQAISDVVGKSMRWPIRQGGLLRNQDLSTPTMVKKSQPIIVTWRGGGISLKMTGIAQQDGAIGDLIQVQNPQSKKIIEATITSPGHAVSGIADLKNSPPSLASR